MCDVGGSTIAVDAQALALVGRDGGHVRVRTVGDVGAEVESALERAWDTACQLPVLAREDFGVRSDLGRLARI